MANQTLKILITLILVFYCYSSAFAKDAPIYDKKTYLTDLTHINITKQSVENLNQLKLLIEEKKPKALYIEQWILIEPNNEDLISKLHKIAKKYNTQLYLVVGRNTWFGSRGVSNTLGHLNNYEKYIDGIVLRIEPNKVNIWKEGNYDFQAQILNQMLDAYSAIQYETKKKNKRFIAEFPFWLSDYKGPLKSFSQNVCDYADRIIFLIDDLKKLDSLKNWNDITCMYTINLTKRATDQSEGLTNETYKQIKSKATFYSNFHGFLIDSDSTINEQI